MDICILHITVAMLKKTTILLKTGKKCDDFSLKRSCSRLNSIFGFVKQPKKVLIALLKLKV